MFKRDTPFERTRLMTPRFIGLFKKLGIGTPGDLMRHFPTRYEDWREYENIENLSVGDARTVQGEVVSLEVKRTWKKRMVVVEAVIRDETGEIPVLWFNQPYIKNILKPGVEARFAGKVSKGKNGIYLSNPTYETVSARSAAAGLPRHTGRLVPIYPETKGLTSKGIRFAIGRIFEEVEPEEEWLPEHILQENDLPALSDAYRMIHFPETEEEAEKARRRFAFEEIFLLQLMNLLEKNALAKEEAPAIRITKKEASAIIGALPFELTGAQDRSLGEVLEDMAKPHPMNRLLQGDVGSGKTVVAAAAAVAAAHKGCQVAFMAPTEILARQHYTTLKKFFPSFTGGIGFLTTKEAIVFYGEDLESGMTKKKFAEEARRGNIAVLIGTHALIQKSIAFARLGLVIVDEQHRFGVRQRAELVKKGGGEGAKRILPHFLSMSATPIPRTIMMTIFGDLDLSLVDELPKGRKEVITKVVAPENRENAYAFVRGQIRKGRQAFVVCPRIEPESEEELSERSRRTLFAALELRSVKEEYEKLAKRIFPDLRVAMLHGKMKADEKERIMRSFKEGETDVLVSTSVIEVGVDVPNATIMIIEGADRFGLAQLYQFRGRVGRGEHQAFCLLFTGSDSKTVAARLHSLLSAKNGFELAEKDLALRGPGEFLGDEQAGVPDVAMKALSNPALIKRSRAAALQVLAEDPALTTHRLLKAKMREMKKEVHFE